MKITLFDNLPDHCPKCHFNGVDDSDSRYYHQCRVLWSTPKYVSKSYGGLNMATTTADWLEYTCQRCGFVIEVKCRNDVQIKTERHPLGLVPNFVYWSMCLNKRIEEVKGAITRYAEANITYPNKWDDELVYLQGLFARKNQ